MIKFAVRGLLARKLRTILTALGVVLGVALVSGTYVLTDSISTAFNSIFKETYKNTDVAVTGKPAFSASDQGNGANSAPSFDEAVLNRITALPDVKSAVGQVQGDAHLIGSDGKAITFGGAPNLGFSVDPAKPEFNTLTLVAGAWPQPSQVVIDRGTADKKHFAVGQTIGVQSRGPVREFRISGLVNFGAVSSIGGATIAGFDLNTAQTLFDKRGQLDQILVAAKPGVSPKQLESQVAKVIPPGTQVRTGSEQAAKNAQDTTGFISFLQTFLLAFGGIALFVGSFVIANSLSITIAQRTREFATLRTLGASRRQVLRSVILESVIMGVLASVSGLLLGLLLAIGLFKLFDSFGVTLPNNGLVFQTRTIVVALAVGIVITVLASLRPALRATRVPPIAAVQEGATLPPGRFHRYRGIGAALVIALGFAGIIVGLFVKGLGTAQVLIFMLGGALLVFIGVALFSSRLVRPLAAVANPVARWSVIVFSILVWPFFTLPYWLLRYGAWGPGATGRRVGAFVLGAVLNPLILLIVLVMAARRRFTSWQPDWPVEFPGVITDRSTTNLGAQNSERDPQRTAATAAALMIGLALVTLMATFAAGIIKPFEDAVDQIFIADYAITAQNNFDPLPPSVAAAAATAPGAEVVSGVRGDAGRVFGSTVQVTGVDKQAGQVLAVDWTKGSQAVFAELGATGAFVEQKYAKDHHLDIGSPVSVQVPSGKTANLKIIGIFKSPPGGSPFGAVTMSTPTFDQYYSQPLNIFTFAKMTGGVTSQNTQALENTLKDFPNAKASTRSQFKKDQVSGLQNILNILYVLLALSVVVSLFGIVNTLVLTVFERTREVGMLRAIGLTRRQTRQMIRQESVITALIGAVIGIVLGLVLAGLLTSRLDFTSFVVPVPQLIIFLVIAIILGLFAAIFPARRAARLNPLDALAYE